jgi:hypothetical protein
MSINEPIKEVFKQEMPANPHPRLLPKNTSRPLHPLKSVIPLLFLIAWIKRCLFLKNIVSNLVVTPPHPPPPPDTASCFVAILTPVSVLVPSV